MSGNDKPENTVQSTVQMVSGVLEKVPIYQDLIQPTAQTLGRSVSSALKLIMFPLTYLGIHVEHWTQKVEADLNKKLENIPEENIQGPDVQIAGPILQALSYTVQVDELRDMFTNLLKTSMDSRTASQVHPSFSEIIKQLSTDEAIILRYFATQSMHHVMAHIRHHPDGVGGGFSYQLKNFSMIPSLAGCKYPEHGPQYLESLQRHGLIELADFVYTDRSKYKEIDDWFDSQKERFGGDKADLQSDLTR